MMNDSTTEASARLDRRALVIKQGFDDQDDKLYWWSRTPAERLRHMELLRRINYGDRATAGLQRILEIAER
jgi:hypothetical protein